MAAFRALPVLGPSLSTRSFVVATTVGADLAPGPLMQTGRPLDIAVSKGRVELPCADPTDAKRTPRWKNADHLNGVLQTHGLNVLGGGGPISIPPNNVVTIGDDGTVSAVPTDTAPTPWPSSDRSSW
jgi:flagellar basal-body rod protein FlgF